MLHILRSLFKFLDIFWLLSAFVFVGNLAQVNVAILVDQIVCRGGSREVRNRILLSFCGVAWLHEIRLHKDIFVGKSSLKWRLFVKRAVRNVLKIQSCIFILLGYGCRCCLRIKLIGELGRNIGKTFNFEWDLTRRTFGGRISDVRQRQVRWRLLNIIKPFNFHLRYIFGLVLNASETGKV